MTTMRQVEKVLRKAGVNHRRCNQTIDFDYAGSVYLTITDFRNKLTLAIGNNLKTNITFKFNSLTSDGDSLYFSYKSQEPLIVKIK